MSNNSKTDKIERKFDLEDRLIDFTVIIADVVESLPNTKVANHIGGQLITHLTHKKV